MSDAERIALLDRLGNRLWYARNTRSALKNVEDEVIRAASIIQQSRTADELREHQYKIASMRGETW